MLIKKILLTAAVLTLGGCAAKLWNKPGASREDFASARYGCLQEAQQQSSSLFISKAGGGAVNGMATNDGLFSACMNSKGWTLTAQALGSAPTVNNLAESAKTLTSENAAMCARPDTQTIMAKSACTTPLITLPQLADESYLLPVEKEQFSVWRRELADRNARGSGALRQFGGEKGGLTAMASDAAWLQLEEQSLALYTGKITWGQYNQARKAISQARDVEVAKLRSKR